MKVKAFISTSLCLLSGWLGLAYIHQVDMDSYVVQENDAPKLSANAAKKKAEVSKQLPQPDKLGKIAAE